MNNPEAFLEKAMEIIRNNRHALAIDGISYVKLDGKEYYVQEIFDTAELIANLDRNAVKVEHSVYVFMYTGKISTSILHNQPTSRRSFCFQK